ncbi:MAG: tRNA(Ile)-lysidine synthase [Chloroflexota bacterium]|jgi:tRNA(Ile)-lysidine synthase|nr:tRNA(Ile)-lysidine synthase [Chloroflexota bacterium]
MQTALTRSGGRRDNLVEAILHACRADPVIAPSGGIVVVGYSGGPDSTALLHGLSRASRRLRLELHAVHVDHGLRDGSAADVAAAQAFCAEVRVPLVVRRVRPKGRGEDGARNARHGALDSVAESLGARTIALGHTADDQVETVLLHLLRGTGLEGLAAMAPREGTRFRPLLTAWRSQVEAYCARNQLATRHDESNDDPTFTRNRVRRELIPLLEAAYNPRARDAILRLANAAREEHEVVVELARAWLRERRGPLPRGAFNGLPRAVRVEVLRTFWSGVAGAGRPAGAASTIAQALRLIESAEGGMIQLGAGFELSAHGSVFDIR